jgi:hypothetical protein
MLDAACALAAHTRNMLARGMCQRELAIESPQIARYVAAIHLPEQNGRSGLDHRHWGVA